VAIEDLKKDNMMSHLLASLEKGEDIGHYGRLVFTMVARHFLGEDEVVEWLRKDPDCDEQKARGLLQQVQSRDYNPPRRERILEWMRKQEFPICPDAEDPDQCNLYRNLEFPGEIYENISEYHEQKQESGSETQ
jgi:DNA primase large subunit